MTFKRLVRFLETINMPTNILCSFKKKQHHRSNYKVKLETFIRYAFFNKEHAVSIFFDLEKAYDTAWKYGILKDLHNIELKGHLPNSIRYCLSNRHFLCILLNDN